MIKYSNIDITTLPFSVIVHFVNCRGTWGAGLAAQLKNKYPEAFKEYKEKCKNYKNKEWMLLGSIMVYDPPKLVNDSRSILISCFTQLDVGVTARQTEYSAVSECMRSIREKGFEFLNFPYKVGCGLGGGNWDIVSNIIENYFPYSCICKNN